MQVSNESHSNSSLKLEKISLPSFSGNCKTFARFKGDFKLIVVKAYSDEVQRAYVLKKSCLKGQAKTLVENIDSLEDIWDRLENKYGNSNDVIHMVTTDLTKLTFQKNDIDLVDVSSRKAFKTLVPSSHFQKFLMHLR